MQCVAWKDLYFSSIDELYVDRMFRLPKCKVDKLGEADICKVWQMYLHTLVRKFRIFYEHHSPQNVEALVQEK